MPAWNEHIFLLVNASEHPLGAIVFVAQVIADDLIFGVMVLLIALWIWGSIEKRAALVATVVGTAIALSANQALGQLWFEPRPFMIGLGHTFAVHVPENSFPSDHATFMWTVGLGLIATGASRRWGLAVCAAGSLVSLGPRSYLGLHFPIDMLSSAAVAAACSFVTLGLEWPIAQLVIPSANKLYDGLLDTVKLPKRMFPRAMSNKRN